MNENEFVEMVMTGNLDICIKNYTTNIVNHNFQKIYNLFSKKNFNLHINPSKYLQKLNTKDSNLYFDSSNRVCNLLNVNILKYIENSKCINLLETEKNIEKIFKLLNSLLKIGFGIKFIYKNVKPLIKINNYKYENTTINTPINTTLNTTKNTTLNTTLNKILNTTLNKTLNTPIINLYNIITEIESIEIIFNYTYNNEAYFIVEAFNIPIIISLD